jgi:hypothetical protein
LQQYERLRQSREEKSYSHKWQMNMLRMAKRAAGTLTGADKRDRSHQICAANIFSGGKVSPTQIISE